MVLNSTIFNTRESDINLTSIKSLSWRQKLCKKKTHLHIKIKTLEEKRRRKGSETRELFLERSFHPEFREFLELARNEL